MRYVIIVFALLGLVIFMPKFTKNMQQRPTYAKLGFVPQGKLYASAIGGFRWFEGEYYTFKSIIYYGSKTNYIIKHQTKSVEYYNLYRTISAAIILNPYNEDAYYFAQGAFTWGIGQINAVNAILKYVYKYRPWDFQIPFFLGFNYAYFLHNYKEAAKYYKEAAKLSHSTLFASLAARYFYEGGRTQLGIAYLKYMIKQTKNKDAQSVYKARLRLLEKIDFLEKALKTYKQKYSNLPRSLKELVNKGIIDHIPTYKYGRFYMTKDGKIKILRTQKKNKRVKK